MELLILGLAIGGVVGARGKGLVKAAAKGYLTLSDKARELGANAREDMRDAIEEARYERETEAAMREEMALRDRASEGDDIVILTAEYDPADSSGFPTNAGNRTAEKPKRNSTSRSRATTGTTATRSRAKRATSETKAPATASRSRSHSPRKSDDRSDGDNRGGEHRSETHESHD